MNITVFGLWHLGCVTAACLADAGFQVTGLDLDRQNIERLRGGTAPLHEPGLDALIARGLESGALRFSDDPVEALGGAELLWVTFDTPVNERDEADVRFVEQQLAQIEGALRPGTLVLISSQVPVGFTRSREARWSGRSARFAYSPENLRLGKAIEAFTKPERVVIGLRSPLDRPKLETLFAPFCQRIEWMSVESAEMTKHALNAFLATSVTFINELARLCEVLGADAKEVERGLKSEGRIGPRAYLGPGAAFAGGTLARDVRFLVGFGAEHHVETPLFAGVLESNERHKGWLRATVARMLEGAERPTVAVLGLTYKPGTSTLRRSAAVELCRWLHERGVLVQAHDPGVRKLPDELAGVLTLAPTYQEALRGVDLVVVATEWPDYRALLADEAVTLMRRPIVVDQNWFLANTLASDARIRYAATGRSAWSE